MFIVFNKQKIYSYLIALGTVIILFMFAFSITSNTENVLQTSTNAQTNNMQFDNSQAVSNQIKNVVNSQTSGKTEN